MKASVSLKQGVDSCMVQAWDQGGKGGENLFIYICFYILNKAIVQWPW